jgi:hypothetical protein
MKGIAKGNKAVYTTNLRLRLPTEAEENQTQYFKPVFQLYHLNQYIFSLQK